MQTLYISQYRGTPRHPCILYWSSLYIVLNQWQVNKEFSNNITIVYSTWISKLFVLLGNPLIFNDPNSRETKLYSTNTFLKKYNLNFHFYYNPCSLIYNSQKLERTQMSLNRGMDIENVVHLHNGVLSN